MSVLGIVSITLTGGIALVAQIANESLAKARAELLRYTIDHADLFTAEGGHNDGEDAFRHAYTSARFTTLMGESLTKLLGDMRELALDATSWEGNPAAELNMDLFNNSVGRSIGRNYDSTVDPQVLLGEVRQAWVDGRLITGLEDTRTASDSLFYFAVRAIIDGGKQAFDTAVATIQDPFQLLPGTTENSVVRGSDAADVIEGTTSGDVLIGGQGDDSYVVNDLLERLVELRGEGIDLAKVLVDYTLPAYVENGVQDEAAQNGRLTGNELDNVLQGNSYNNRLQGMDGNDKLYGGLGDDVLEAGKGDDMLVGGSGHDVLYGGADDDTYLVQDAEDEVVELANEGIDTVLVDLGTYVMPDHVEKLQLLATGTPQAMVTARGNAQSNEMAVMGSQYAYLRGEGGDDVLYAGLGGANLNGGAGNDKLYGGSGRDSLDGRDGGSFDELYGGAGDDQLFAEGDYVKGGAGDDMLFGSFNVGSTYEWGVGDGRDTIRPGGLDTVKFTGSGYALTATLSGPDLILTTDGRNGTVLKNWNFNKPTIELPDGRRITGAEMNALVHPAVTGWQYSGGSFSVSNLYNVAVGYSQNFAEIESFWTGLNGQSVFEAGWQSGLELGAYTGRFQDGKAIRSWGFGGSYSVQGLPGYDPNASVWANLNYDFWQTASGGYEVAITSLSAGHGGQHYYEWDESLQDWRYYPIPGYTEVSVAYSNSQVVLVPAVTSAVLYEGLTTTLASPTLYQAHVGEEGAEGSSSLSLAGYDAMVYTQDVVSATAWNGQLDFVHGDSWLHFGPTPGADIVETTALGAANVDTFGRETRVSVMPVPTHDFRLVA